MRAHFLRELLLLLLLVDTSATRSSHARKFLMTAPPLVPESAQGWRSFAPSPELRAPAVFCRRASVCNTLLSDCYRRGPIRSGCSLPAPASGVPDTAYRNSPPANRRWSARCVSRCRSRAAALAYPASSAPLTPAFPARRLFSRPCDLLWVTHSDARTTPMGKQ